MLRIPGGASVRRRCDLRQCCASLTPTELDVVRLVSQGLNNPEIGTRLLMSRGTVKTHLAHVCAKLGIANRTELATVAAARLAMS